jgi:Spy/CpxP family protein refolding chaperone
MAMLFEGITLTEAQQTKVDSITAAYRAERQKMMPNGMQGGPPDDSMRQKMREMMDKQNTEIRGILTADQQKVFDANVEKRKQAMQQRQNGR